jgi:hypothetical protein
VNEYVTKARTLERSSAPITKMSKIRFRKPILRGRNRCTEVRISLRVRFRRYRALDSSEKMSVTIASDSQAREPSPHVWGWLDRSLPSCEVVEYVRQPSGRRRSTRIPTLCPATIRD